jgi:hypothetical protein
MSTQSRAKAALVTCVIALAAVGTTAAVRADGEPQTVVLRDVDDSGAAFRFSDGTMVTPGANAELYLTVDLMLDLPHGLGANNSEFWPFFTGKGGIVDVGAKPLRAVKKAPKEGYLPAIEMDAITEGHTYCVRTGDGEHYAKLHLGKFDREASTLEFTWEYQPKPTNVFP